jgi:predicted nucleotidyltransferase
VLAAVEVYLVWWEIKMDDRDTIKAQRQQEAGRILARLNEMLPPILAQYPVDAAYVYGSVARGTVTPFSDVDIALLLTQSLSAYDRLQLELTIQGEVEATCGLPPADVRAINQAPLLVQGRIVQEGILLYELDRVRRVAFEVETRKRYFDFVPVARRLQKAFLQRVHRKGLLHGRSRYSGLDPQ